MVATEKSEKRVLEFSHSFERVPSGVYVTGRGADW